MTNITQDVRDAMLATLAKYFMKPASEEDIEALEEKYGEDEVIRATRYLISRGIMEKGALFENNAGTEIDPDHFALTAVGWDIATGDPLGYKISSVTVNIHSETLNRLADIVNAANLKPEEKQKLLSRIKEKGADYVISRCLDLGFANAAIATQLLSEYIKSKI